MKVGGKFYFSTPQRDAACYTMLGSRNGCCCPCDRPLSYFMIGGVEMERTDGKVLLEELRKTAEDGLFYGFCIGITPEAVGSLPFDVIRIIHKCRQSNISEDTIKQTLSEARKAAWEHYLTDRGKNGNGHWHRPWQPRSRLRIL